MAAYDAAAGVRVEKQVRLAIRLKAERRHRAGQQIRLEAEASSRLGRDLSQAAPDRFARSAGPGPDFIHLSGRHFVDELLYLPANALAALLEAHHEQPGEFR